jgi:hypothetical protein
MPRRWVVALSDSEGNVGGSGHASAPATWPVASWMLRALSARRFRVTLPRRWRDRGAPGGAPAHPAGECEGYWTMIFLQAAVQVEPPSHSSPKAVWMRPSPQ